MMPKTIDYNEYFNEDEAKLLTFDANEARKISNEVKERLNEFQELMRVKRKRSIAERIDDILKSIKEKSKTGKTILKYDFVFADNYDKTKVSPEILHFLEDNGYKTHCEEKLKTCSTISISWKDPFTMRLQGAERSEFDRRETENNKKRKKSGFENFTPSVTFASTVLVPGDNPFTKDMKDQLYNMFHRVVFEGAIPSEERVYYMNDEEYEIMIHKKRKRTKNICG